MGCLWVFRVYWKSHNQQNSSGFQLELFSPTKPSAFWKASECNRDVKTFHHRQAPRNGTAFTLVCCGTWRSSIWILFAWISFAFLLFFVSFHLKNTSTIGLYLTWKWKTMYKEKRRDFVVKTWICLWPPVQPRANPYPLEVQWSTTSDRTSPCVWSMQHTVDQFRQMINIKELQKDCNKLISCYAIAEDA